MVSLASRLRAAKALMERGVSRSRSCRVVNVSRQACGRHKERNPDLREQVLRLAHEHPRYGFRRVQALLPGVNLKAVHRIWLSLKVRRRLKGAPIPNLVPTAPNQAWCMDFACERLANGRQARILAVLDCFTRECLVLKARF